MADSAPRQVGILIAGGVGTVLVLGVGAWLISKSSGDVGITVWLAFLILAIALLLGGVGGVALARGSAARSRHAAEHLIDERLVRVEDAFPALEEGIRLSAAYIDHILEICLTVRALAAHQLDGVTLNEFMEHGILNPARDVLTQTEGEEIRISLMVPAEDDPSVFVMLYAVGHTIHGRRVFRRPIDSMYAGIAYRTGNMKWSNDRSKEPDFVPNPSEKRPFASIVAMPVVVEGNPIGVLSVVSTVTNAFPAIDRKYIQTVGTILGLAWGLPGWQHERPQIELPRDDHPNG